MQIEIIVKNSKGEIIAKRSAFSFPEAEQELGKLEHYFEKLNEKIQVLTEEEKRELEDNEEYYDLTIEEKYPL